MGLGRYVVARVAFAVFAMWLVLTATFCFVALTPDPNEALVAFGATMGGGDAEEAVGAYRDARNRDEPLVDRYVRWVVGYATLDWGISFTARTDGGSHRITDLVLERGAVSLVYVGPALVLALVGGVALGLFSATNPGTVRESVATTLAYGGQSMPNFFIAQAAIVYLVFEFQWYNIYYQPEEPLFSSGNLIRLALPTAVLGVSLLTVQARYARSEAMEHLQTDFVKLVRAKGASRLGTTRHVLRNAAAPLLSLFFTETLAVLFVTIYVIEVVFRIPGFGALSYGAIQQRDMPLILGTTFVPVMIGLAGDLLQDLAYAWLDPRVASD